MWLGVPGSCESCEDGDPGASGERYHAALLALFSVITRCMECGELITEAAKTFLCGLLKVV